MLVFVEISLSYQSPDSFQEFSQAVERLPYILECHLVSGDSDYLIKARISDISEYRALLGEMLLTLPGVKNSKSYIVMEEVKESLALPLDDSRAGK
jgi:Lrp/AsnC family leucine-responsive transcriptional regulator